ncbi:MAG: lipopolysaccharide biosynthesis protein, partial [Dehalococcoidia bacterium]
MIDRVIPARVRPLIRSIFGTIATALTGQAALLLSGVLSARILGPENRGHVALFVVLPSVIFYAGNLGLPSALAYFIAKDRTQTAAIVRSLSKWFILQVTVLTLVHALVLVILLSGKSRVLQVAGFTSLPIVPAFLVQQNALSVLQGRQRFGVFNLVRLLPAFLFGLAVLALYIGHAGGLIQIMVAWTITVIISAIATAFAAAQALGSEVTGRPIPNTRQLVGFGLKSVLGSFSPIESFQVDQILVGLFLSPAALGLYVVGQALTNLPRFVSQSVGMVAYPYIASLQDRQAAWRSTWQFFWLNVCTSLVIVLGLAVATSYVVPVLFGKAFAGAVPVAHVLLAGAFFLSVRRVLVEGLRGSGYPIAGSVAEVVSWFWLIPAFVIFTPRWGVIGAGLAVSSSAAFALALVPITVWLQRSSITPRAVRFSRIFRTKAQANERGALTRLAPGNRQQSEGSRTPVLNLAGNRRLSGFVVAYPLAVAIGIV